MSLFSVQIEGDASFLELDESIVQSYLEELAEMARSEWIRLAQQNLHSTAADYIAGIQPVEYGEGWAQIRLLGWLPNAIEEGLAPFDMKPGLLRSPKAKTAWKKTSKRSGGQTGYTYITVPFRHGTPGTTGNNVGAPMPYTHMTKGGKPKSLIYNKAIKLSPSVMGPGGIMKWGQKMAPIPVNGAGYGQRSQLAVAGGRPGAYTWKHSPYEGIYKVQHQYDKAKQNQYVSFRRVSSNSDPNSWWHPGIIAHEFAPRVVTFVEGQAGAIFA